jgi:hypothetical protein
VRDHDAATIDVALYAGSVIVAGATALFASIPLYREAGRIAVGPYAAGAVLAGILALRKAGTRARSWLAVAVLAGVLATPLALEVTWRWQTAPGLHAQSEAIITEEAAKALWRGGDPYVATYIQGPLAARPLATQTHYPYLPLMLAFGLPRAMWASSPLTDARVAFAAATLSVAAIALRRWNTGDAERRLRAVQVLAVLPTGALLMVSGGDDLPVVALMFLALVLLERRRPAWSGAAAGMAAVMKQTAWPLLPFLVVASWRSMGRRAGARTLAACVAVSVPSILAFLAWSPSGFVEDAIRFPLGLGRERSVAETPTLGSLLIRLVPQALRTPLTVLLVTAVAALIIVLLLRTPPATAAAAAGETGLVFLAAIVLAPAARIGYVVYPINLLAWWWLFRPAPARGPARATLFA